MKNKVYSGQSFLDKVVEISGDIENTVLMSIQNNRSITDELEVGQVLEYTGPKKNSIVEIFNEKNRPASALTNEQTSLIIPAEGIGVMIIEDSFIVF